MNRDSIEGSWKQFKGKVKAQWGKLTGNQLDEVDGKRVELSGKLQEGYGNAKDAVEEQSERLQESAKK
ncbi:CsbD family protein [Sedimenticola selenatireducens]|uniref:CsbD family protein n=1 Tax=Sedimenticola selenatireducens TaxID=191960 RepID=UPI00048E6165|nr:CsbD family protein [Sedimenticola selenatireducens]